MVSLQGCIGVFRAEVLGLKHSGYMILSSQMFTCR